MTKEQILARLIKNEIIVTRGPRGALSWPWKHQNARRDVLDHIATQVEEMMQEQELDLKMCNLALDSYKEENHKLKEQIKDLKA